MEFNISNRIISIVEKKKQLSYNSDYIAHFTFDEEWNGAIKTARFIQFGEYVDVVLDNNDSCSIPIFKNGWVIVGVFSNTMTTTYTEIYFNRTVKDENGNPEEPTPDVYSQLLEMIKNGMLKGENGLTPIKGVDYFTEAEKDEIVQAVLNAIPVAEGGEF